VAGADELLIHYDDQSTLKLKLALLKIYRFMDPNPDPSLQIYPAEIFAGADSVFDHVSNSIGMAFAQVEPPEASRFSIEKLTQTLASHDTPELIAGDHPVLLDQAGTVIVNFTEARKIMDRKEYRRFLDFEQAHTWLEATPEEQVALKAPRAEAVVANIIDLVQGNSTYFEIISHYRAEHLDQLMTPQLEQLLSRGTQYFTNKQNTYLQALGSLPAGPQYDYARRISQQFLDQQEEFIPLSVNEIRTNSNALRWLRFGIISLLGSFCVQLSIKKIDAAGDQGTVLERLLTSYLKTGKSRWDPGRYHHQYLRKSGASICRRPDL
jgi:hypothetical protein